MEASQCVSCIIGHYAQKPSLYHGHRASEAGDLIHMDITGPWPVRTPDRKCYFFAILDNAKSMGWGYLLAKRLEALGKYKEVEAVVKNKHGKEVGIVCFDGGKELCQGDFEVYLKSKGVRMQLSVPYAHVQNGKAEQWIWTIQDKAATIMAESGLPPFFWGYALLVVVYITNRLPTTTLPLGMTPYKAFWGDKPDLSLLCVFGC
jgi:Integrase core domain